jgi:hypothetical protein
VNGVITGEGARDRAVKLAGALAEAGVETIEINDEPFGARETDLPGRLLASLGAGGCAIHCGQRGLMARLEAESCAWSATDPELIARLADISDA